MRRDRDPDILVRSAHRHWSPSAICQDFDQVAGLGSGFHVDPVHSIVFNAIHEGSLQVVSHGRGRDKQRGVITAHRPGHFADVLD